jgi:dCMP deaminase
MKSGFFVIIAYVPVLHEGYRRFFDKYKKAKILYLLGKDITGDYVSLQKDIRAMDPKIIKNSLKSWKRFSTIDILNKQKMIKLNNSKLQIIMPDDEINKELSEKYFPNKNIIFDTTFLRWDKHKASQGNPVKIDQVISSDQFDQDIIEQLRFESKKSSDFWRSVGAAILKDRQIVLTRHNTAVPSELMPYVEGDPRGEFHKGVNIDLSTALHAEAGLIAEAAKKGLSLEGVELFVTTFPCPSCAKLIAYSGIRKIYYADGYGVLDAERILKSRGIEIVFVETKNNSKSKL